ncbi:urea ABC transporter permease subunit UrtB [Candidatus Thiothrix sp. Deng01]|uniref:Urea ABC transporter permease subunit UrtB n=1 Tax=Candidatus Thiothrix phosphatis TaxID=3112415 RepID=A0ABU6D374_9GAMM|nr:urea ABC transporter permease subunit UrtB [Candidatus Thiothrix sp. Deng01]MEB4593267.1 urea ABC transporter permease subunit UrtB [Candidatus Thiothrix sp. Deng01]
MALKTTTGFAAFLAALLLMAAAASQADPASQPPAAAPPDAPAASSGAQPAALPPLQQAALWLQDPSFQQKANAIELLANSNEAHAQRWLEALLNGKLYADKQDNRIALLDGSQLTDAITGNAVDSADQGNFSKITINNSMRKQLRAGIARLSLASPDDSVRLQAVNAMLDAIDPDSAALLQTLAAKETNPAIHEAMQLGVAMSALNNGSAEGQLAAIATVSGSLHPKVRNRLANLASHANPQIAAAAKHALQSIDERIALYGYAETLFFGLSLGSVLVLAAIGLAITFGVMGVINMAHGELIMLGAYTTWLVQQLMPNFIDYSLFIAIPAAFIVSGAAGIFIERSVIRHLYGRPLETLLATFGVSLILQQLVRTVISPQNVPVSNPAWMSGTLDINAVLSLTLNRLYIILFCLLVFAALFMILRKTHLGLQVRAVSQNRAMARAMGVRSARVDALTFGLGSGIAGVAGVALSQLTNVGPNLGQSYIIDSFMVVVFGGVGNLWGTLLAGLSLGVINKVLEPWAGAVLAKILVLVFIILFIQKRPRGLFPQKGRAAGD